jgi:hypothetical protein
MHDVPGDADSVDIVFQADDRTPCLFVSGLLESTSWLRRPGRIARDGRGGVTSADLRQALDDMLFTGGKLNLKLLGGVQIPPD